MDEGLYRIFAVAGFGVVAFLATVLTGCIAGVAGLIRVWGRGTGLTTNAR